MILKARAEKGSVSELFLVIASSSFWYLTPLIAGTSKGDGKKSTNHKKIGDFETRLHYVNKSLDKLDFDGWEHIDIENSDL